MIIGMCFGRVVAGALKEVSASSKTWSLADGTDPTGVDPGLSPIDAFCASLIGLDSARALLFAVNALRERDFWCFFETLGSFEDCCFLEKDPLLEDVWWF